MSSIWRQVILNGLGQYALAAVLRLGDRAYGVTILEEVSKRIGKDVSIGTIYTTLYRLENRGFLVSAMGEATAKRGGRAKKFYSLTPHGHAALSESLNALDNIRTAMSRPILDQVIGMPGSGFPINNYRDKPLNRVSNHDHKKDTEI